MPRRHEVCSGGPIVHPGAWLVWAMCSGTVAMLTTNPLYLFPLYGVALFVYAARRRAHPAAGTFRIFVVFGLLTVIVRTVLVLFGPVTAGSVAAAALEGLRLATMLAVFGAFNSVVDPLGLIKLAPRRWHEPALAGALALSIAPRTLESARAVREAQRMRGIEVARWRSLVALAVPVLEIGMERALTLAESMDARGHGRGRRSRYRPERFSGGSWIAVTITCVALALFVGAAISGTGFLIASTAPLELPNASPSLVVAIAALAVPAVLPEERSR